LINVKVFLDSKLEATSNERFVDKKEDAMTPYRTRVTQMLVAPPR